MLAVDCIFVYVCWYQQHDPFTQSKFLQWENNRDQFDFFFFILKTWKRIRRWAVLFVVGHFLTVKLFRK